MNLVCPYDMWWSVFIHLRPRQSQDAQRDVLVSTVDRYSSWMCRASELGEIMRTVIHGVSNARKNWQATNSSILRIFWCFSCCNAISSTIADTFACPLLSGTTSRKKISHLWIINLAEFTNMGPLLEFHSSISMEGWRSIAFI